jgi:hypothetical protein
MTAVKRIVFYFIDGVLLFSALPVCLVCFATMFIIFGIFLIPLPIIVIASLGGYWYLRDCSPRTRNKAMIFARALIFASWISLILLRCFANCVSGTAGFILLLLFAQAILVGTAVLLLARFWDRIVFLIDKFNGMTKRSHADVS